MSEIEEALFPLNKIDVLILVGLKRMNFDTQVRTRIIKAYKHIKLMRKREIQSFLFKNPTRPQRIPFAFENNNLVELVRKIGIEEYTKKYIDYLISLDINLKKESFNDNYKNLALYNCIYNESLKKDTIGSHIVNVGKKLYLSKENHTSKDILVYSSIPKLEDIITNIDIPDPDSIIESVILEQYDNTICYFNKYEDLFNLNITIPIMILWDVRIKIVLKRIGKLKEINILYHALRHDHRKNFINDIINNTIDNIFIMDIPPTRVVKDNSIFYYKKQKLFYNSDINNEMYDIYTTIKYPIIGKAVIDLDN